MLIFSDIHFGIANNSKSRLADVIRCLAWIVSEAKQRNEKTCVFLGDWMHERSEVDVLALETAKKGLALLCQNFDDVYFVPGNHDYYYNNSDKSGSFFIFDGLFPNLHIVKQKTELDYNGKKLLLAPWFYSPEEEIQHFDVLLGHFEFLGGRLSSGPSKRGHAPKVLTSIAPLVFTGHYHLVSEYSTENGKIVVVGSPYQQDWGDAGDNKRIIFFDGEKIESAYNKTSPTHIKLQYSKISSLSKEQLPVLFGNDKLKNNFVKVDVDSQADYDKLKNIIESGNEVLSHGIEQDFSSGSAVLSNSAVSEIKLNETKDIESYVLKFVKQMISEDSRFSGLEFDEKELEQMISSYFAKVNGEANEL